MEQVPTRSDARANRQRVIDAAFALFRERGLDAEMTEIAQRAGVGVGTLYRNFPTKEHVVAAIVGELFDRMQQGLAAASLIPDPIEAICALIRTGFQMVEEFGDMMPVLHRHGPAAAQMLVEKGDSSLSVVEFVQKGKLDALLGITEIIRRGVDAGIFRPDLDPEIAASRVITSFEPHLYQRLRLTRSAETIVDAHTALFLRGVVSVGQPSAASAGGP